MSWYRTAFGARYLELYAHRDAAEAARALDSLFSGGELEGAHVLDLACGPGRYLGELRRRGARALGVDLSPVLLEEARRTVADAWLLRADMRRIPLQDRAVDTTLSMFTSFGYFDTVAEHAALALEMARVTRQDVVVDVPNPPALRRNLVPESERTVGGRRVLERRWIETEPARVCKRIEIGPRPGAETYEERVLLFSALELETLFDAADFAPARILGDYDGAAYDPEQSPRTILRFTRRPAP